jgi:hypothetical protein
VSGSAPDDVWAVGTAGRRGRRALIEHWDGSAWRVVPPGTQGSLQDVAALGPGFALAVGSREGEHETKPLALRWNGDAWIEVVTVRRGDPDPITFNSIGARSPRDAWAVGYSFGDLNATMAQHWDGTRFHLVPTPTGDPGFHNLNGATAIGPDDVWAVGHSTDVTHGPIPSLTQHWDGSQWRLVPSPNREFPRYSYSTNLLRSVDAVATDEVWAVGYAQGFNDQGVNPPASPTRTLTMRWTGERWRIAPSPNAPDQRNSQLEDVTALSDGHAWAVGSSSNGTLIMARC